MSHFHPEVSVLCVAIPVPSPWLAGPHENLRGFVLSSVFAKLRATIITNIYNINHVSNSFVQSTIKHFNAAIVLA